MKLHYRSLSLINLETLCHFIILENYVTTTHHYLSIISDYALKVEA